MALHTNLDAVRKPIVEKSSIDEAPLKVASLGSALGGLGGGLGGSGGGGGMGGGGGGLGGSWNGRALAIGDGIGHTAPKYERAEFIKTYAKTIGLDPTTALRVAQSEGFNKYTGDQGRSFGDFQMFTGGGVGNRALKAEINVRDRANGRPPISTSSTWQSVRDGRNGTAPERSVSGIGRGSTAGITRSHV